MLETLVSKFLRHERRSAYSRNSTSISSTTSTQKASVGQHPSTNCTVEDTTTQSAARCPSILVW
jgi:hypothetical protein